MKWKIMTVLMLAVGLAVTASARNDVAGALYTMTNAASANEVLVFQRGADGRLSFAAAFATGGNGTGAGLGNQGGVVLSSDNRFLLVVNAGSNDISVFGVAKDGLRLLDRVNSGGLQPISVTIDRDLVYVLNAGGSVGGSDSITGFTLASDGTLTAIPGSAQPLSAANVAPAQIQFSPHRRVLVVTEKNTNNIVTYTIGADGLPSGPQVQASAGATPFGFAFGKRNQLFVSEAFGGAADASAVSSYEVSRAGSLNVISASVGTTETAACWVVVTNDGKFAYTTNTGSGSISGYEIGFDGTLNLLNADGRTGVTGPGSAPIDMALSDNGRFLYTLNSGNQTISAFRVKANGQLTPITGATGLPPSANGLAAR